LVESLSTARFQGGRQLSAFNKYVQANSEKFKPEVEKRKASGEKVNLFGVAGEHWKKVSGFSRWSP
jgi:hypothetical protein